MGEGEASVFPTQQVLESPKDLIKMWILTHFVQGGPEICISYKILHRMPVSLWKPRIEVLSRKGESGQSK